jgi:hypothetical protein
MLSFIDPTIVLSMFMLSFIFKIVCGLFEWKQKGAGFYRLSIYIYQVRIQDFKLGERRT